ncbi:MAG: cupin protein [Ilumatobacteraceae bacterium]|nr:cupin protein [Ilumatobacteraceae bacterium]MCU1388867.1 cupin protein [Ilumatobacteraceae bacterium]
MNDQAMPKSLVRSASEGERRWFYGGGLHIWKATATETNGAFLLFEDRMDFGKVTPLHTHPDSDETMVVLEGEIRMHLDGDEHVVGAGGIASAPRGVPHAFMVSGADGARLLCLHTPGCCQAFYWDASEPVADGDDRALADGPLDMSRVMESAKCNGGIEILGPPPFTMPAR